MRLTSIIAAALGAACLAACQPAQAPDDEATATASVEQLQEATTTASTSTVATAAAAALPCGVLAQRDWQAEGSGSPGTLTVSGQIDLGTPGYGVSLTREDSEAASATTALLKLELRAPSGVQAQVVTPHPVRYFGPARSPYEQVEIRCDGAVLTTIMVRRP